MSDYKPDPMFNDPPEPATFKQSFKMLCIALILVSIVLGSLHFLGALK
jgi:hypothetical protein